MTVEKLLLTVKCSFCTAVGFQKGAISQDDLEHLKVNPEELMANMTRNEIEILISRIGKFEFIWKLFFKWIFMKIMKLWKLQTHKNFYLAVTKKYFNSIDTIKDWNAQSLHSLKMKNVKMPLISYRMKTPKDCGVRFSIWKIKLQDTILKVFENNYLKGLVWHLWSRNKKILTIVYS